MDGTITRVDEQVYAHLKIEGVHWWADCPLEEVSYLKFPHRHLFHIKAYRHVNHSDRDVEFIVFKHRIREYLVHQYWDDAWMLCKFGGMSCEMIANELIKEFDLCKCEVSEDGENGAVVTSEKVQ